MKRIAILVALVAFVAQGLLAADTIATVRKRGTLVVGVKADYEPFGFKNASGEIVGLEPDLARDLASRLGVNVKLVPVTAADRIDALKSGKVDVLIATLTDLPERRKAVRIVDPDYYASGMNVLAKTSTDIAEWSSLGGKTVCGIEGSFYNSKVADDYGATLLPVEKVDDAIAALEQDRCVAFVYDSAFIAAFRSAHGRDWDSPFRTLERVPWGIAIANGDDFFATFLSGVVVDWHLTGKITDLERKYHLPNDDFALEMTETLRKVNPAIRR